MQKWEYITIYIVMTSDFKFMTQVGSEIISGNKVWEYINSLGQMGWELVSVVERIGNEPPRQKGTQTVAALFGAMLMGQSTLTVTQHKAVTLGYFYHFKREILQNTQPLTPKSP
jgi:hypothetical protein